jgi:hypothetical protein
VHEDFAARTLANISHDSAHSDQRSLWSDHGGGLPCKIRKSRLQRLLDP